MPSDKDIKEKTDHRGNINRPVRENEGGEYVDDRGSKKKAGKSTEKGADFDKMKGN
ncbi:MAG TPA: hypothetical protein VF691_19630 [Cytophagaceae bacterium]|jgi:hypothetical protein